MTSSRPLLAALLLALPLAALAEDPPAAEAAADAKAAPTVKAPAVTFNGLIDAFYTLNLGQPQSFASPTAGAGLYSSVPGFNFNYAKLAATVDAGAVGAKMELGYGRQGENVGDFFVQQGYVTFKTQKITVDAGRFYTPAGFEVFDNKDNYLYSKGLLFNFTVPTAHEGVRANYPLNDNVGVTLGIANGSDLWTNDKGLSASPYKTVLGSLALTQEATSLYVNLFFSKVPAVTPGSQLEVGDNAFQADVVFSQGLGDLTVALQGDVIKVGSPAAILGIGGWAKAKATEWLNVAGRVEYVSDKDMARAPSDKLLSLTGGVGVPVGENAEIKGEFRWDHAADHIYDGKAEATKWMTTATVGVIAWF